MTEDNAGTSEFEQADDLEEGPDTPQETSAPSEALEPDLIELPTGDYLDSVTSYAVTRAAHTRVIIVAGGEECGKTTLLSSIYEKFQEGPFAGLQFAGSRTLPGFEMRCHLARIASERTESETERTKARLEDTLLHLKIGTEDSPASSFDILFTDLAGERFRLARDSIEECRKIRILRRADHFVLMIDGQKLTAVEQRQSAYTDGRSLLRSCLDAKMLGKKSLIDVLISKSDLIEARQGDTELEEFLGYLRSEITREFEDRVGRLRFFDVAARPESQILPFAYNLERLLPSWALDAPSRSNITDVPAEARSTTREIDRYVSYGT